jgi:hypothetical protein
MVEFENPPIIIQYLPFIIMAIIITVIIFIIISISYNGLMYPSSWLFILGVLVLFILILALFYWLCYSQYIITAWFVLIFIMIIVTRSNKQIVCC